MGALTKPELATSDLAEVFEMDGRQVVRLPEGLHLEDKQFRVSQSLGGIQLEPVRRRFTDEERSQWLLDIRKFQEELGDPIPGGRNQGITEPEDVFPEENARNLEQA